MRAADTLSMRSTAELVHGDKGYDRMPCARKSKRRAQLPTVLVDGLRYVC